MAKKRNEIDEGVKNPAEIIPENIPTFVLFAANPGDIQMLIAMREVIAPERREELETVIRAFELYQPE
jgi:hypothetical protein